MKIISVDIRLAIFKKIAQQTTPNILTHIVEIFPVRRDTNAYQILVQLDQEFGDIWYEKRD